MWEKGETNEKFLCDSLSLKSNTLTPLLKKLLNKGFITKKKSGVDERNLVISLTEKGKALQDKALCVPPSIAKEFDLSEDEAIFLYQILYKILGNDKK